MSKQIVAMILAGGKGTRLYELTKRMQNLQYFLVEIPHY